jgi:hypothetical protein
MFFERLKNIIFFAEKLNIMINITNIIVGFGIATRLNTLGSNVTTRPNTFGF